MQLLPGEQLGSIYIALSHELRTNFILMRCTLMELCPDIFQ